MHSADAEDSTSYEREIFVLKQKGQNLLRKLEEKKNFHKNMSFRNYFREYYSSLKPIASTGIKFSRWHRFSKAAVVGLTWTNDGLSLLATHRNGNIALWDPLFPCRRMQSSVADTLVCSALSPNVSWLALGNTRAQVLTACFEPDGSLSIIARAKPFPDNVVAMCPVDNFCAALGSARGSVRLWDVARQCSCAKPIATCRAPVTSLRVSADGGLLLATGARRRAHLCDLRIKRPVRQFRLPPRSGLTVAAAWVPRRPTFFVASERGLVTMFDVRMHNAMFSFFRAPALAVSALAVSQTGRIVATLEDARALCFFDTLFGRIVDSFEWSPSTRLTCIAMNPLGYTIAASTERGRVCVAG
eukprot:gnl/Chilomastix_cuspidata/4599.p1 GENE.gnl/Chilomastix_cuspidata/4599~~gnl/Chilomastix_cuspidata/4599.p1  ORF type:complete len:358 (+),score=65.53 gnl/Chilomastix_cuspidata/4599:77-1150(+)